MPRPKPPPEPSPWIKRGELLVLLRVSIDKLREFRDRDGFPRSTSITAKLVYFNVAEVLAWIDTHRELVNTEAAAFAARRAEREQAKQRIVRTRPDPGLEADLLRGY